MLHKQKYPTWQRCQWLNCLNANIYSDKKSHLEVFCLLKRGSYLTGLPVARSVNGIFFFAMWCGSCFSCSRHTRYKYIRITFVSFFLLLKTMIFWLFCVLGHLTAKILTYWLFLSFSYKTLAFLCLCILGDFHLQEISCEEMVANVSRSVYQPANMFSKYLIYVNATEIVSPASLNFDKLSDSDSPASLPQFWRLLADLAVLHHLFWFWFWFCTPVPPAVQPKQSTTG